MSAGPAMKQAVRWTFAAAGALAISSAAACVLVIAGAAWWAQQKH